MAEMKIKGSKNAIRRVIACMKADYNYLAGKPAHKHFFRVFDVGDDEPIIDNGDGTFTKWVWFDCAWSVNSCMCSGAFSYYNDCKANHPDIFMGTTIAEQSHDCEIEIFSEEEGMGFSEHYLFRNGECLIDDTCEIEQAGYDDYGNITTDINWDEYDGETLIDNPYRINNHEEFRWELR